MSANKVGPDIKKEPKFPESTPESMDEERLTSLVYETTVHPSRYDELVADWDSHIRRLLLPIGAEPLSVELDENLARHFSRALHVFERIGRALPPSNNSLNVQDLVDTHPNCALAFDGGGHLAAVNEAACQMLGLPPQPTIEQLPIDGGNRASIRDALRQVRASGQPQPLVVRDINDRPLVLLATAASPEVVIANAVSGHWSEVTERLLQEGFGVSATELTLLKGLYSGLSLRQIAERRSRSIGTVRTQLKAIQQKTGAHSQSELIRLVTGLVFASNSGETEELDSQDPNGGHHTRAHVDYRQEVQLRDKRRMDYDDIGSASDPSTFLFLHGMLDTPNLPMLFEKQIAENRMHCLNIHRPGFGRSSRYLSNEHLGELFAADVREFLDVLNLEKVSIIGHMSGGALATIAAALLPERIQAVVSISGGVPILHRQQFEIMTPRQRAIALTARYAPKVLPLILRAGIALLDSGGEQKFMNALHRHSPRDHQLTQREDVFAHLADGYRHATIQGYHAFQHESMLITSNWDDYVRKVECPLTFIHGKHDGVVSIASVRDFARRHEPVSYTHLRAHETREDLVCRLLL